MTADARPNSLLHGPVLPTLARLATPNVLGLLAVTATSIAETSYIGLLGRDALAAMAIVFPLSMLMQTFSQGAMGGAVSSAISRAIGAGDMEAANSLARHAVAIALAAGLLFAVVFLTFGDALYELLGARGEVLEQAKHYGTVLFAGASFIWLVNTLISIVRGTGNMLLPSATLLAIAALQIAIGASLGFGWGPFPRLGIAGVALGQVIAFGAGCIWLACYIAAPRRPVRVALGGWQLTRKRFWQILRVGLLACMSPLQSILTVIIMTGFVARLGVDALAGYGIGARLEFLALPLAFGIGVAALPLVGMAVGSGDIARARRVAWVASGVSAALVGTLGIVVAVWPRLWSTLFTRSPEVLHYCAMYLQHVSPAYVLLGMGFTLYFAAQGAGKLLGPVLAGTLRLAIVVIGGWLLTRANAPELAYFVLVGAGMVAYGIAMVVAVRLTPWGR